MVSSHDKDTLKHEGGPSQKERKVRERRGLREEKGIWWVSQQVGNLYKGWVGGKKPIRSGTISEGEVHL